MRSGVWGNQDHNVTQEFGVNLPSVPDAWYRYAADWGFSVGTHIGIDVGMPRDTPIYAAADGVVIAEGANLQSFRPNPVTIETPDDPNTPDDEREHHIYGHLWSDVVSPGQRVRKGELIGYSGEQTVKGTWTPDGSGPHLHFERRDVSEGQALDPRPLLDGTFSTVGGGMAKISAEAINRRIAKSEAANGGNPSPISGMGALIVQLGDRYGINPAVVVAIMQRECQLGAAIGDALIPLNNFGGNTAIPGSVEGTAGARFFRDRHWQVNATPADGIEAVYKTLDKPIYRNTGGRLEDVLHVYAPPDDGNDYASIWSIFDQVGIDLGTTIGPDTNIYDVPTGDGGGGLIDWPGMVDAITRATADGAQRTGVGLLGVAVAVVGAVLVVGPQNVANAIPAGRVASLARGAS